MALPELRIDKTAFSVGSLEDQGDDRAYWFARSPQERLQHVERLRRLNYGHRATEGLQRVLEIVERTWG
jgi:hypothetical protein